MYQGGLVACIKVAGKILRESNDSVALPFGCEYSLLIKNLNSVRVQVRVSVDGDDATEGTWLVIAPNDSLELERFIKNGNWHQGNRFKFIERTEQIESTRGIGAEDGLIRVEWKRELIVPKPLHVPIIHEHHYEPPYPRPRPYPHPRPYRDLRVPSRGPLRATASSRRAMLPSRGRAAAIPGMDSVRNDAGITVAGSVSNQRFSEAQWFPTEDRSEVLILRLLGRVGDVTVAEPITVERKPKCKTCGRHNKANSKFCSECGAALEIVA